MNDNEILGLLIYATELDGRHTPNEAKVYAWREVLDEGAPGMTVEFARDVIRKHYANQDVMLSPAMLVRAHREQRRSATDARLALSGSNSEAHCGRTDCACTHTEPCFKGWFDELPGVTSPCPVCRPTLANALDWCAPLGQRTDADYSRIRNRKWEDA